MIACGARPQHDAAVDAAVDAGAPRDAAASQDAGATDAGERDASRDAARPDGGPDDPGWVPMPFIPQEDCKVEIAQHPERLRPSIGWESCGEGCRGWTGDGEAIIDAAWHDGDGRYAAMHYAWSGGGGRTTVVFELDEGIPLVGTRKLLQPRDERRIVCGIAGNALGRDGYTVSVGFSDWNDEGEEIERAWVRILTLPFHEPVGGARLTGEIIDYGANIGALKMGDGFVAGNSAGTIAWHAAGGVLTPVSAPLYPDAAVQVVQVAQDAILWESWGARVGIAAWTEEEPARVIREVERGDVRGLATDGTTIAWQEGTDYDTSTLRYAHVALWTGTFADGVLRDVRRVRDDLIHHSYGMLGAGYYVTTESDPERPALALIALYRLADGARAQFQPPGGIGAAEVLDVSATEMLIQTNANSYYRIDPRTLDFEVP